MRLRVSSAHYPQSNGRAESGIKAAKHLVADNTTASGALDTDRFLRANMAYRNSMTYSDTGKSITQSLMGRHLRDSLPNVKKFYQIKREFVMERKESEIVVAMSVKKMSESYDKGSRSLPTLSVGDHIRVQNQTTNRTTKWDKTGMVIKDLGNRQYEIMIYGSRHITMRNRRHLRRIPGKKLVIEEGEEEDEYREVSVQAPAGPAPAIKGETVPASPARPASPASPAVSAEPAPVPAQPDVPVVPAETVPVVPAPVPAQVQDEPRRSGRSRSPPNRLEVTGQGKSYAAVIRTGRMKVMKPPGEKDVVRTVQESEMWQRKCLRPDGGT